MKLEVYEKIIPIKMIKLGEKEYTLDDVREALNDMLDHTNEDDRYGEYSLRDYELSSDIKIYEWFVKEGLFKNYTGSRMANLFCLAKGKTSEVEELRNFLCEEKEK